MRKRLQVFLLLISSISSSVRLKKDKYTEVSQSIVKHGKLGDHHVGYYSLNLINNEGEAKMQTLHRLLGLTFINNPEGLPFLDHINRNSLDNRLQNLRWISASSNCLNKTKKKNASTIYMGVSKVQYWERFIAKFKGKHIGTFTTPELAAIAYNAVAAKHNATHLNVIKTK